MSSKLERVQTMVLILTDVVEELIKKERDPRDDLILSMFT
jgi:hypothetical protein